MNPSLGHKDLRQVRIAVQGNTIWRQTERLFQRCAETCERLPRQAINQIDRNRFKTGITRRQQYIPSLFKRLNPVNGLLHQGVKILNPQAHTIKAHLSQQMSPLRVYRTWINLDRVLAFRQKIKTRPQDAHQSAHLVVGQKRGRAATPV